MRIQYDSEVDILTVRLGDVRASIGGDEIAPGVWLDQDGDGTPLRIRVAGASKRYDAVALAEHPAQYDRRLTLGEAAELIGDTSAAALQKAAVRGRLHAAKVGGAWMTTIADVTDYVNSRVHEGPGSAASSPEAPRQSAGKARRLSVTERPIPGDDSLSVTSIYESEVDEKTPPISQPKTARGGRKAAG